MESFWQEAIATDMETPEFKFTAQGTGESYDHCVKISFDDGKVEDCDNVDQYNDHRVINNTLIKEKYNWDYISDNLVSIYKELL